MEYSPEHLISHLHESSCHMCMCQWIQWANTPDQGATSVHFCPGFQQTAYCFKVSSLRHHRGCFGIGLKWSDWSVNNFLLVRIWRQKKRMQYCNMLIFLAIPGWENRIPLVLHVFRLAGYEQRSPLHLVSTLESLVKQWFGLLHGTSMLRCFRTHPWWPLQPAHSWDLGSCRAAPETTIWSRDIWWLFVLRFWMARRKKTHGHGPWFIEMSCCRNFSIIGPELPSTFKPPYLTSWAFPIN